MKMDNLELYAANTGLKIAEELLKLDNDTRKAAQQGENHITKSLGVLQEDGVYAFFLYQQVESRAGQHVYRVCGESLQEDPMYLLEHGRDILEGISKLSCDLPRLLLTKELLNRAMVYARYHFKAAKQRTGAGG